jgi:hypothetical protein
MNIIATYRKLVTHRTGVHMRTSVRTSLVAVAVFLVALTSVAAPMASSAAAGTSVPFAGAFSGTETNTGAPPTIHSVGNWTGVATHLGRFTVVSPHDVKIPERTATGKFTFMAANGDTVTADFFGQASTTANPNVLSIVEHGTITGGTGRFADATGTFTVRRLLAQDTATTIGFFTGSISSH